MIHLVDLWNRDFVSYRRFLLDRYLTRYSGKMCGVVLDVGGKRKNKRGQFRPPEVTTTHWWYMNISADTTPDILADAGELPVRNTYADCIVCIEVLEHLPDPAACVCESFRVLKKGGTLIASVPFLYPIHADPHDFQRFTEDGLRHLFHDFACVQVERMGGFLGTLGMLLELGTAGIGGWLLVRGAIKRVLIVIARALYWLDARKGRQQPSTWSSFTTGYFVIAVK